MTITRENAVATFRAMLNARETVEFDACDATQQFTIACEELNFDPDKVAAFTAPLSDGDSITIDQFTITATIRHDDHSDAPWDAEDGHGAVSDWRQRNYSGHYEKRGGELVLCSDGASARFYDYAAACNLALRDGWGYAKHRASMTPRQYAALAARADYNRLAAWCDGQWCYVGVIVTVTDTATGITLSEASLWGCESDDPGLHDHANGLTAEALSDARNAIASLANAAGVTTQTE